MHRMSRALVSVAVIATTLVLRATMALAQSYPGGGETPPPTAVKGKTFFRGNGGDTAGTGTNVLLFLLLAMLALVIGLLIRHLSRRRATAREA